MFLAPIGFTFLLPKSQLQGHFSLCPAAEKPSYFKPSLKHGSESEKSQSQKAAAIITNTFPFSLSEFLDQNPEKPKNSQKLMNTV